MITVELSRASRWNHPDPAARQERRLKTHRCSCKTLEDVRNHAGGASTWFFRAGSTNHREENGITAMDMEQDVWLVDIPSIEHAYETWGRIVVDKSDIVGVKYEITIYDSYLE